MSTAEGLRRQWPCSDEQAAEGDRLSRIPWPKDSSLFIDHSQVDRLDVRSGPDHLCPELAGPCPCPTAAQRGTAASAFTS